MQDARLSTQNYEGDNERSNRKLAKEFVIE